MSPPELKSIHSNAFMGPFVSRSLGKSISRPFIAYAFGRLVTRLGTYQSYRLQMLFVQNLEFWKKNSLARRQINLFGGFEGED